MEDSDMVIVIEQNYLSEPINKDFGKVVEVHTKITSNDEVVLEEKQSSERYETSDLKKAIDYLMNGSKRANHQASYHQSEEIVNKILSRLKTALVQ